MRKDLPSLFYASGPLPPYDNLFLCLQAGRWDESLLPALYHHLTKRSTICAHADILFPSRKSQ